ncbi:DUF3653 domain-containing protein [Thaumasiovibrio sp. DFM-14]|uniref:DUF3653 domain-containing protein n=1 Tax=Thaumasiovibrio sp. DFM-14 TaxID=3384792 RepID=UPI0039A1B53F
MFYRQYHTDNFIFRHFKCGLSIEKTSELCFKSERTITEWDKGKTIPPECKRLMRLYSKLDLKDVHPEWEGWKFQNGLLVSPNGYELRAAHVETGAALIELGAPSDKPHMNHIMKVARSIAKTDYMKNSVRYSAERKKRV